MSNVGSSITLSPHNSQKIPKLGYLIVISIAILVLITIITLIFYSFFRSRSTASPPHPQLEEDVESGLDNATLETWPKLTYVEAKSQDVRASATGCCTICLVDFEEHEDDKVFRLLPECGHLFHAICVDPWLLQQPTCPVCRSSAVTPLAE